MAWLPSHSPLVDRARPPHSSGHAASWPHSPSAGRDQPFKFAPCRLRLAPSRSGCGRGRGQASLASMASRPRSSFTRLSRVEPRRLYWVFSPPPGCPPSLALQPGRPRAGFSQSAASFTSSGPGRPAQAGRLHPKFITESPSPGRRQVSPRRPSGGLAAGVRRPNLDRLHLPKLPCPRSLMPRAIMAMHRTIIERLKIAYHPELGGDK